MDIGTLIAGGGLVAAGAVLQRIIPAPRRHKKQLGQPICGCKHHRSFHANGTDACSYTSTWKDPCTCKKYVGPEPLPELYASGYSDE